MNSPITRVCSGGYRTWRSLLCLLVWVLGAWVGAGAQAAPAFQAAGTAASGNGAVSPAWPPHAVDDVALLLVETGGAQAASLSSAQGFVEVAGSPVSTGTTAAGTRLTVFWARATSGSMPAPTVADAGDHVYARILTYRNVVDTGTPWDVSGGGTKAVASTALSMAGVTTTVPDTLVVQAAAHERDATAAQFSAQANGALTGLAERADEGTNSGNGGGLAVWDGVKASPGAIGTTTATLANSVVNAYLSLALKPQPPEVVSINRASFNPNTSNASVAWTVTFSESVTGVDAADFALVMAGGASGAAISAVSGAGTTWTVTANSGTAYGTLGLNLVDNDTITSAGATPLAGAGAGNGSLTGAVYTLAAPVVQLSKVASASAAAVGDLVTFTIIASNPYGVDLPALTVSDVLPAGMGYAANVVTAGTLGVSGQTVTWSLAGLTAGSSAQLTLVVTLTQQGVLSNTVTSAGATSASASVLALASAVTHFHLDEPVGSWSGAVGEVLDSGGTALHGRRVTTATPTTTNTYAPSPTIASQYPAVVGGFCNAARFDGSAVVEVADSPLFDYTTTLSASAWIYPTAYPAADLYSILSNDQNYEFHLNTTGNLFWWWGASSFSSATTIPLNQWTHVAITMDSSATGGRQRIYINGVLDANSNNWKGTLATNTCKFYVGGDVATGSCALLPGRNFRGSIDEVKLYSYELSAAEVQADMTLGRNCAGTFDHVRIEHDGAASVCTPESVTIKACLNASCSTLYPGNVTVNLSPSGWVGGDTVVLSNGVGTRALSVATPGNVTLGSAGSTPTAANATRCFNGGTETCTLNFANASCLFDAVENGANPQTRLFTKMAGTAFSVDVLALSGTAVNTSYVGSVNADLVDASTATCPAGAGLTAAQSVVYVAANAGRKPTSFTYAGVARNVRVRMRVGAGTPACSTDNFAIRPASVSLVTSPAMATPPSASAAAVVTAGAAFTLNASATPGYTGTVTLDNARLTAQTTTQDASIAAGGVVGTFSPATLDVNAAPAALANARYDEVGYLYLAPGAFRDETFTAVDQPTGCVATSSCDCITSTGSNNNLSTALVGATGKYGCHIGSTSASLGRFVPDHFAVAPGTLVNRQAAACPAASAFSYAGEALQVNGVQLTARNARATPATTQNYQGVFARFDGNTVANFAWGAVDLADAIPPLAATAFSVGAGAGQLAPVSSSGSWTNGVGTFSADLRFNRAVAPDGPYASVRIGIAPRDADAVTVRVADRNLDIHVPADAINDKVLVGSTQVRWGRMRLHNRYGSEYLPLAVPVQAQYWLNGGFIANTDDSCTLVSFPLARTLGVGAVPDGLVNTYFYPVAGKNLLTAADTTRTVTTAAGAITTRLGNGAALLAMSRPNKIGWLDTILDVPDYLRYNWGNCMGQGGVAGLQDDYPCARATFGVYKSPLIYRRENY